MAAKEASDEERVYPLARLSQAIAKSLEPLTTEVAALRGELVRMRTEKKAAPVALPMDPVRVCDLESTLKAKGLWDCGEQRCRDCSVDQNLFCMDDKGVGPKKGGD